MPFVKRFSLTSTVLDFSFAVVGANSCLLEFVGTVFTGHSFQFSRWTVL